jgi:hypothetical protein
MTASAALGDGMRRVNRAPAVLAGVWLVSVVLTLPMAFALRAMLAEHLASSLAADSALSGVNYGWWQEFDDQATGLGATFRPTIIGFGAVLDNLSTFVEGRARPAVLVGAACAYMAVWLFLAGGIIDRYARDRATRSHGFFAACGVFFWRFLRLAVVMWAAYALVLSIVQPWLFGEKIYGRLTRDMTVERSAFFVALGLYAVVALLLAGCNLIFDYAKVRAVVEDRRSMFGAVRAALGFIGRNRAAAILLYALDVALFLFVLAVYALVAPGAGSGGFSLWIGFAVGQLYVLARLWVKLVFWASETALFQGRLAHAAYVAAPTPTWPDSPAAEAISRS